jgi:hypothetical protein
MKGIPRKVAEHKLNIKPGSKPVKLLRRFNDEKCKAIDEEIVKLLSAGFIREVFHPERLANPVLVKKKNKKWRMCVDYTSLNKACPKDPFPLPRIDQVVDSTAGCEPLFSRCVLQVPPDSDVHSRPTRNLIHHSVCDMGTHGSLPARVPEVPNKWTRPARIPADLQVGLENLSTIPVTLEDLGRPYPDRRRPAGLVEQTSP